MTPSETKWKEVFVSLVCGNPSPSDLQRWNPKRNFPPSWSPNQANNGNRRYSCFSSWFIINRSLFRQSQPTMESSEVFPSCSVCDATSPTGLHFGAVTCYPCRAFFRSVNKCHWVQEGIAVDQYLSTPHDNIFWIKPSWVVLVMQINLLRFLAIFPPSTFRIALSKFKSTIKT